MWLLCQYQVNLAHIHVRNVMLCMTYSVYIIDILAYNEAHDSWRFAADLVKLC